MKNKMRDTDEGRNDGRDPRVSFSNQVLLDGQKVVDTSVQVGKAKLFGDFAHQHDLAGSGVNVGIVGQMGDGHASEFDRFTVSESLLALAIRVWII